LYSDTKEYLPVGTRLEITNNNEGIKTILFSGNIWFTKIESNAMTLI